MVCVNALFDGKFAVEYDAVGIWNFSDIFLMVWWPVFGIVMYIIESLNFLS
jgi:hypothetical protein